MSRFVLAVAVALCGFASQAHAGDSAAMKMLPPGTTGVLQIDLAAMRGTTLYKELWKVVSSNPEFLKGKAEAQEKMGFDLEKDLSGITVAVDGSGEGFVVLAGKFNEKKITGMAKKEGKAKQLKHQGVAYWAGEDKVAVAFLAGRVVVGKEAAIKSAIGAHKGKRVGKAAEVMKLAKGVDQKKHVWGAAALPKNLRDSNMKELSTMHGFVDLTKGLSFLAVAAFDTEKTAQKIVADVEKALTDAQANPGMAAFGVGPLLAKVKASNKGKAVSLAADWNEQDVARLKALAGMAGAMMGAAARPKAPMQTPKAPPAQTAPSKTAPVKQ